MAAGDLCQPSDVVAWLPNPPGPNANALIGRLITAASAMIALYTGRSSFAVQAYNDTYDGSGRDFMLLRQWPVTAVTSISIGSPGCPNPTVITSPGGSPGFLLESPLPSGGNQRLTLIGECFLRGRSNAQVAYQAGYATIPFDVAQACIELVGEAFQRRERIGQVSVSMKDQTTTSFSQADMNAAIKAMLAPYRRLVPC